MMNIHQSVPCPWPGVTTPTIFPPEYDEWAKQIAEERSRLSRLQNNTPRTKSGHMSGTFDLISVRSELFVCLMIFPEKYEYQPFNSFKEKRDLGPFEIEAVDNPKRRLILREYDRRHVPLDTPYISVVMEERNGTMFGHARGWIRLGEGLDHSDKEQFQRGVWFIPTHLLHPLSEWKD